MAYDLEYWPAADQELAKLENDPKMTTGLNAVDRTLAKLASDPFSRGLGTTQFQTDELGSICATPVRYGHWYVVWQRGPRQRLIDIVNIIELTF